MTAYRQDPPPDELREYIYYRDGAIYWTDYGLETRGKYNRKTDPTAPRGSLDNRGYLALSFRPEGEKKSRIYKLHRLIYWLEKGEWPPVVDHIDGNTLNNDINNLRASTTAQNVYNRNKIKRKSLSKFIGVRKWTSGKFAASIKVEGRHYDVPGFDTEEAAALYRDLLVYHFHGEHGKYNFLGKKPIRINGELIHDPKHTR